jgi:predicted ATPase
MRRASAQGAKLFKLRTATNVARLQHKRGRCTEARDLLTPIYNWFTEGFDTPVLQEAKALLEQLSG